MKQIKLSRYIGIGKTTRRSWKDLIAALALNGYEVYADEKNIVFTLGSDDKVKDLPNE